VLVANIDVSTGEMSSILTICLPFAVLESFFTSGAQRRADATLGSEREREVTRELTESSVRATRLDVSRPAARLPHLAMRELAALRVGGVISTGIPTDAELEVRVNGAPASAPRPAAPAASSRCASSTLHPPDDRRPSHSRHPTRRA
jgi:flagellar motor switch protein FliM